MPATAAPPRFLDTFRPRMPGSPRVPADYAGLVGTLSVDDRRYGLVGGGDLAKTENQLKHYTHWVYVAVRQIAQRVAEQLPQVSVVRRGGPAAAGRQRHLTQSARRHVRQRYGYLQSDADDMEPVAENHPLVTLLHDVNPGDTWFEFVFETVMFLELTGSLNWLVVPNGVRAADGTAVGQPAQLWVIPPHWVDQVYAPDGTLVAHRVCPYRDESRAVFFPPEWVIRARDKHPLSKTDPYSNLEAGALWVDNVDSIEKSRRAAFSNGVNPGDVAFELDAAKYTGDVDKTAVDRIRARFRHRHQGLEQFNREPLILPPGVTAKPLAKTNLEMDFVASAEQARDCNLALFATPPVIAGVSKDYNRATADAAMLAFCEGKVEPRLRFLAGVMTEWLARRFDASLCVWYQDCRPEDAEFGLRKRAEASKWGGQTPNDWREYTGQEASDDPAYDTGYMPMGMTPLDGRLDVPPLPANDGGPPVPPPDPNAPTDGEDVPQ